LFGSPAEPTDFEISAATAEVTIDPVFDARSTATVAWLSAQCIAFFAAPAQCPQVMSGTFRFGIPVVFVRSAR